MNRHDTKLALILFIYHLTAFAVCFGLGYVTTVCFDSVYAGIAVLVAACWAVPRLDRLL